MKRAGMKITDDGRKVCECGWPISAGIDGRLPMGQLGVERAECEALCELLLPRHAPERLGKVDPLAGALFGLWPVCVEREHVELEEMVRRRGRLYCCHKSRDGAADAGYFAVIFSGSCA